MHNLLLVGCQECRATWIHVDVERAEGPPCARNSSWADFALHVVAPENTNMTVACCDQALTVEKTPCRGPRTRSFTQENDVP